MDQKQDFNSRLERAIWRTPVLKPAFFIATLWAFLQIGTFATVMLLFCVGVSIWQEFGAKPRPRAVEENPLDPIT